MNGVRRIGAAESSFIAIVVAAAIVVAFCASPAFALEARLMKESAGAALIGAPCVLPSSTDGTAANYRWYNVCSGYIWIFYVGATGESAGVLFGGPEQPEVNDTNHVKRAITYWRNVVTGYSQTVDILVEPDVEGDGCPDTPWLIDRYVDVGLRWNCSDFGSAIPAGVEHLVVRFVHHGGASPTVATDGIFSETCNPNPVGRSFYYGLYGTECVPWIGPGGSTGDNFLFWLILDRGAANATKQDSWGAIKGLFR